ncbi:hypothetical protein EB155_09050 [archaeon]|nr:hypothetical protein [archaeon]NDB80001.1 hypothetical protein [archaeon]
MPTPFLHTVAQIREKVQVLHEKTEYLYKIHMNDDTEVQHLIDDIRALAGDIYNDRLDNIK